VSSLPIIYLYLASLLFENGAKVEY